MSGWRALRLTFLPCLSVSFSSKLTILSEERAALLELWELRRQQYEQCMDLQLFYRDTEQVDNWMSKQEVMCERKPCQPSEQSLCFCFVCFADSLLSMYRKSLPFQF